MTPNKKLPFAVLPLAAAIFMAGCGDDNLDPDAINAPDVYEFASLTDPSAPSSVDYREATTRLILIKELEYLIGSEFFRDYGKTHTKQDCIDLLNRIYTEGTKLNSPNNLVDVNLYSDASESTPINGLDFQSGLPPLQTSFFDLYPNINLKEVMPGEAYDLIYRDETLNENGLLIGWRISGMPDEDHLPHQMMQAWFNIISTIATERDLEDENTSYVQNNIDYKTLAVSFLLNSIPYSQAFHVHLNEGLGLVASNTSNESPYTDLMHQWDLAYGNLGASYDVRLRSHASITNTPDYDSNKDDVINLFTEYSFDLISEVAQRDIDSQLAVTSFTASLSDAFITGRVLIDLNYENNIDTPIEKIGSQIAAINKNWERANAANIIHHINQTAAFSLYAESTILNKNYAHHWSNLKGLALSLQFNPAISLSQEQLESLHENIGQLPINSNTAVNSHNGDLFSARQELQTHYDFSQEAIDNW